MSTENNQSKMSNSDSNIFGKLKITKKSGAVSIEVAPTGTASSSSSGSGSSEASRNSSVSPPNPRLALKRKVGAVCPDDPLEEMVQSKKRQTKIYSGRRKEQEDVKAPLQPIATNAAPKAEEREEIKKKYSAKKEQNESKKLALEEVKKGEEEKVKASTTVETAAVVTVSLEDARKAFIEGVRAKLAAPAVRKPRKEAAEKKTKKKAENKPVAKMMASVRSQLKKNPSYSSCL